MVGITANDDTAFSSKIHRVDSPGMAGPTFQSLTLSDIPEKNLPVSSNAGESCVVRCNRYVEYFIAMGGVRLYKASRESLCRSSTFPLSRLGIFNRSFQRIEQSDSTVRSPSKNLWRASITRDFGGPCYSAYILT